MEFPSKHRSQSKSWAIFQVRDLLAKIWLTKPETSQRVKQRVGAVLDYAVANGIRPSINASSVSKGPPKQPKSDRHFAAMPYEAVPAFVARLRSCPETMGRLALQFAILTASRPGEVRGATWREIDIERAVWTIPAERMKAGKEHVVPLSAPAVGLLRHLAQIDIRPDQPVFPNSFGKRLSDMTLLKVVRDMVEPFTVHGFRSSFKDWASETTVFPDAVSEAALAHLDANKVRAAYRRTDFFKMRVELMDAWAKQLAGL